ncbi:MAG TPA: cholesterol esterase, partial [Micromonosporaceae bacterium]|nr:cholesterol esterase [Micromonosporaceae bacterium]
AGDAVFTNIDIGTADSALSKGGTPPVGLAGNFGQEADTAVITNLRQRFYSTSAGEFHLTGMSLNLKFDGSECFTTITP